MKDKINLPKFLISMISVFLVAIIGSIFTASSVGGWYQTLNKPFFNPPGWLFGPVWTVLYILIGISLYLFLVSKKEPKRTTKIIFKVQLFLNLSWSILFFGINTILGALICIFLLDITLIMNIIYVKPFSKTSAGLLIPYLIWISFATILNLAILILN